MGKKKISEGTKTQTNKGKNLKLRRGNTDNNTGISPSLNFRELLSLVRFSHQIYKLDYT